MILYRVKRIFFAVIQRTVVGVFKDIIWADPSKREMPMVIAWVSFIPDLITVRLNPNRKTADALATVNKITKELNPVYPVEVKFVDALYQQKFERERTLSILSNIFGGLSIFISCLRLLGLSAYSAELRTKEIGIRKVLGASNVNIVRLLIWSFIRLVLISIVIAAPLTWYLMDSWLMKFDFHIRINGWIMGLSAISITLIAFLTVSYQAINAAKSDPVKAIKYE
ncbi:ABC transporter permease [Pedobacter sp. WC2501]|uniref:ABC transporter permease n=1 Tax=Pedobacter sp. WC2501 TaxID=3461400 RepID=UPI0040468471